MMVSYLTVGSIVIAVLAFLLVEVPPVAAWAALKLTRRAVRKLPEELQATKSEEWLAELAAMKGARVSTVILALALNRAASRLAAMEPREQTERSATLPQFAYRLVSVDGQLRVEQLGVTLTRADQPGGTAHMSVDLTQSKLLSPDDARVPAHILADIHAGQVPGTGHMWIGGS